MTVFFISDCFLTNKKEGFLVSSLLHYMRDWWCQLNVWIVPVSERFLRWYRRILNTKTPINKLPNNNKKTRWCDPHRPCLDAAWNGSCWIIDESCAASFLHESKKAYIDIRRLALKLKTAPLDCFALPLHDVNRLFQARTTVDLSLYRTIGLLQINNCIVER